MRTFTTIIFLTICNIVTGQKIINDFEQFLTNADTFDNGVMGSGGFLDSSVFLPNSYDHSFDSWGGWAISNKTDTITPGFLNQYSCIAGEGAKGSETYAVTSAFLPVSLSVDTSYSPTVIDTIYVNNTTYAYLSLRDGDQFAKRFGGETGDDPDFFKLTIKKYLNGELAPDSIEFFLADYRFDDNSEDYIVRDWTPVDLSPLGQVDSLLFTLHSSDMGAFGINTPTYFCLDYVVTGGTTTPTRNDRITTLHTFPNPATDELYLSEASSHTYSYQMINAQGVSLGTGLVSRNHPIQVAHLPSGAYYIQIIGQDRQGIAQFIKE